MKTFFSKPELSWIIPAVIACALVAGALLVPLWKMQLVAPQYPKGLVMYAYGYKFESAGNATYDDVREINELNHYIGMKKIKTVNEMKLFIPGIAALIGVTLLVSFVAWKRRWLQWLLVAGFWFMPLFFIIDLQGWLYYYGHTMDPEAALNVRAFTPKVFGSTKVMNFHSETSFQLGFYFLLLAALVITIVPPSIRWYAGRHHRVPAPREPRAAQPKQQPAGAGRTMAIKVVLAALLAGGAATGAVTHARAQPASPQSASLQQRIDAAAPEDIIVVDGGVFRGAVVINKPISLIGHGWPVIDGGGQGDVVTISADDVVVSGFVIQGSGRNMSDEAAAVSIKDANRAKVTGNRLRDSRFGIHITNTRESTIENNDINTEGDTPIERRGHGIYAWEMTRSNIHGNTIRNVADGIHLEFSDDNGIGGNDVTDSRYALHFMYAHGNAIVSNKFHGNLAGAVLMLSHDLVVKDNEFSSNRRGATGSGMLLKDDDNIFVEGNRLMRNKYGMTVEGSPQSIGATAIFQNNLFALNDVGVAAMSNAPITFVGNAMIDNTVQVKAMSGELALQAMSAHSGGTAATPSTPGAESRASAPKGAVWTSAGRGNYWSDYRGYDANGDGVGDQPYEPRPPFAGRLGNEDTLRLFQYTPAQEAIDIAADLFPLYRYRAVIEDNGPLMQPPAGLAMPHESRVNVRLLGMSAGLLALTAAFALAAIGGDRRRAVGRRLAWGRRAGGATA